jgi:hypothetical protein
MHPLKSEYESIKTNAAQEKSKIDATFERAQNYMSAHPNDVEGLVWWSAIGGVYAENHKNLKSLRLVKEMEQKLLAARSAAPCFQGGAIETALAGLYEGAPRFISIGSKKKAEHFKDLAKECSKTSIKN